MYTTTTTTLGFLPVNYGWQCPACRKCFAPSITECPYCPVEQGADEVPEINPFDVTWGGTSTVPDTPSYYGSTICGGGTCCNCKEDGWP